MSGGSLQALDGMNGVSVVDLLSIQETPIHTATGS